MKKFSVFFSEQDRGWEQVSVPVFLQDCDYESLVNWAAWQTRQKGLKGFLVSENPNPFPLLKRRARLLERGGRTILRPVTGKEAESEEYALQEVIELLQVEDPARRIAV